MSEPQFSVGERLAKRVATLRGCSRSEAEKLVEGGWVRVNGVGVDEPAHRVPPDATIEIDPEARPQDLRTLSVVWHKPIGQAVHLEARLGTWLQPDATLSPWHLRHLRCAAPLPADASGLTLFAQDPYLLRQWIEIVPSLEHEWWIDVAGQVGAEALERLRANTQGLEVGHREPWLKVSIGSQDGQRTRLRLAIKHYRPEALRPWLNQAGIEPQALVRSRIGRLALGKLPAEQWRVLQAMERV